MPVKHNSCKKTIVPFLLLLLLLVDIADKSVTSVDYLFSLMCENQQQIVVLNVFVSSRGCEKIITDFDPSRFKKSMEKN